MVRLSWVWSTSFFKMKGLQHKGFVMEIKEVSPQVRRAQEKLQERLGKQENKIAKKGLSEVRDAMMRQLALHERVAFKQESVGPSKLVQDVAKQVGL